MFSVSKDLGQSPLLRSAIVAAMATGEVVGRAFLDHYAQAGKELRRTGYKTYGARHSRPYLVAAIGNFLPEKRSWLER